MSLKLEIQEAGTGRWFPIVFYMPGTRGQHNSANQKAADLGSIGFRAKVSKTGLTNVGLHFAADQLTACGIEVGKETDTRHVDSWESVGCPICTNQSEAEFSNKSDENLRKILYRLRVAEAIISRAREGVREEFDRDQLQIILSNRLPEM